MQINIINEAMRTASQTAPATLAKSASTSFRDALETAQTEPASKHFVEMGETLSSICRGFLQSSGGNPTARDIYAAVDKVTAANGLSDRNRIMAGSELDLSVLGTASKAAPVVALASAAPVDAPVSAAAPVPVPVPEPAIEQSKPGIQPDPIAAVAQGPLTPLAIEIMPSQAAMATLQPGFASLGLREAPIAPELPLVEAKQAVEAAASLSGMGMLATAGEGTSRIPAYAAIDKVVKLMESLVEPLGMSKESASGVSPWSQVLAEPSHLTSEFGIRRDPMTRRWVQHDGLDLAAPQGTAITPMKAGEVVYSGWQAGYGKMVIVRHDDGLETVYGHSSKLLVHTGERVSEDTPLAEVGSTGRSTGSHLHFEVRQNGQAVDPIPFLTTPTKAL